MQRAVLGFRRWTENFTFAGGSYESAYPVTNLNVLPLTRVAKTTDLTAASCQFYATSPTFRPLRFFGICRHNMTDFALFRLKLYSDEARTDLIYDSDWKRVWEPAYKVAFDNWYRPGFWGGLRSPLEKQGITPFRRIWLPQTYYAKGIEVFFRDAQNPDGKIIVGNFEIAQGLQLYYNPRYGAQFGVVNRDVVVEAEGGITYSESKQAIRVFQGEIVNIPLTEAKQQFFEFLRIHKSSIPFLWSVDPDDITNSMRDGGLFTNNDIGLITYSAYDAANVPINFREYVG